MSRKNFVYRKVTNSGYKGVAAVGRLNFWDKIVSRIEALWVVLKSQKTIVIAELPIDRDKGEQVYTPPLLAGESKAVGLRFVSIGQSFSEVLKIMSVALAELADQKATIEKIEKEAEKAMSPSQRLSSEQDVGEFMKRIKQIIDEGGKKQ